MLGAIAGDVIGSIYEFKNIKTVDFELFTGEQFCTDDTILTAATADVLLHAGDYAGAYRKWAWEYPGRGYGGRFSLWLDRENAGPYNSFGNGSAMRVSPIGFFYDDLDKVLLEAERSAAVTHDHPEGIKGAQAVAAAIFLARTGEKKEKIKNFIESRFGYNLKRSLDSIRPVYKFDETCQGSVPEAIIAFLESDDFEHAIRLAVSIGGDTDTIACITGAISEAFYGGVPGGIAMMTKAALPLKIFALVDEFYAALAEKTK